MEPALGYLIHPERTRKLREGNVRFLKNLFGSKSREIPEKVEIVKGQEPHVRVREIWEEAKILKMHKGLLEADPETIVALTHISTNIKNVENYRGFWNNYWLLMVDTLVIPEFSQIRCYRLCWLLKQQKKDENNKILVKQFSIDTELIRLKSIKSELLLNLSKLKENKLWQIEWYSHSITSNILSTQQNLPFWHFLQFIPYQNKFYKLFILASIEASCSRNTNSITYIVAALNHLFEDKRPSSSYLQLLIKIEQFHISVCKLTMIQEEHNLILEKLNLLNKTDLLMERLKQYSIQNNTSFSTQFKLLENVKELLPKKED
jgi:hypothetical protein